MHVALVIGGGLALLGLFALFGWLWGASAAGVVLATKLFVPVWLAVAATNLWVGVAHAGYTLRQEAPIFVLVFAVPAAVAALVVWRMSKG